MQAWSHNSLIQFQLSYGACPVEDVCWPDLSQTVLLPVCQCSIRVNAHTTPIRTQGLNPRFTGETLQVEKIKCPHEPKQPKLAEGGGDGNGSTMALTMAVQLKCN